MKHRKAARGPVLASFALLACTMAVAEPGAAFLDMQDRFEKRVAAATRDFAGSHEELLGIAAPIAESVFGADWRVVAAESRRLLGELPVLDLASYARVEAEVPLAELTGEAEAALLNRVLARPGQMAAMGFFDPDRVGNMIASIALAQKSGALTMPRALVGTLMSNQVFRARLGGEDALAVRAEQYLVVVPYTVSEFGLIAPRFARTRVYPRH